MNREAIVSKIEEIVRNILGEQAAGITEGTLFVEDLGLDSLSLLEVAVDVDYAFRLDLPEEELQGLRTVGEAVDKVMARWQESGRLEGTQARVA